ncbi:MAG: DNA-3-methyladenine glycosylase 2 family protein [Acetatifactor sp.]|nr:DNA-3-methyladenine glycosylase 2 family protein [Acetatifactor sp.]MDE7353981.1 DNA-3-methyladenine glycosylase 2 family protein [Acetatifactor sp.]
MHIRITDDFDLKKISDSGQCFRVKELPGNIFRFICGNHILYLEQTGECEYLADTTPQAWESLWKSYFDLERNYGQIRGAINSEDTYLTEAAECGKGIRILRQDPWEMLVTFIISQRKNIPAIRSAVEILCRRYGQELRSSRETLYAFPSPQALAALSQSQLRDCGLGYRAPYVADAARQAASKELDLQLLTDLPDEALLERLEAVKGVGIKVASCISLFAYGRTGIAPVDTWIRRVIQERYQGRDPFPGYGPAAGILQQYMFYHALFHKKEFTGTP